MVGTTIISALLDKQNRELLVANLGDSRCVLAQEMANGVLTAHPLSRDHKPLDPTERARIEHAGCVVSPEGRINGTHALSRAIGDFELKNNLKLEMRDQAISNEPEIQTHRLSERDLFLVLACDGLYDVLSNQQIVDFVYTNVQQQQQSANANANENGNVDLDDVALKLANHAIEQGSTDNVTVCIITLPHDV